jgi:hypothetical protein
LLALVLPPVACAQQAVPADSSLVKIEPDIVYNGTRGNIRLSNGAVELVVSTTYGPRILRYAAVGSGDDTNLFATFPLSPNPDPSQWYIRGGHRLWHAPEDMPRSYQPDNDPLQVSVQGNTIQLIQPEEKATHIRKELDVTLDTRSSHVTVVHKLTNRGLFPVEMACWGLSAMNRGGTAIFPREPYQSHEQALLPVRALVLWAYTDLSDRRFVFGKQFLTLRQDVKDKTPEKIGLQNRQGWAAYLRQGTVFLKRFGYDPRATYPDSGCNNESFTNEAFLELESLGPLQRVAPGQTISHVEHWWLFPGVKPGRSEADLAAALAPLLQQSGAAMGR